MSIMIRGAKVDIGCPSCGGKTTKLQHDEYACKQCRIWLRVAEITDEEMIDWFALD